MPAQMLVFALAVLAGAAFAQERPASPTTDPPVAARAASAESDPALLAVLWAQHAAEHRALCRQVFNTARAMLDPALADPAWTAAIEQAGCKDLAKLPAGLVVDVDETVLDNMPVNARCIAAGTPFTADAWTQWTREAQAAPLPGAVEFLISAAARGITVFYVTNRSADDEAATRRNLARFGLPLLDREGVDVVLCRGEYEDGAEKAARRARAAATHRILLLLGDDLGDFLPAVRPRQHATTHTADSRRAEGQTLAAERLQRTEEFAAWLGVRWFLLPNPVYGSWLDTLKACALPAGGRTPQLASQLVTKRAAELPAAVK